jgi:hypothetical protein
MASDTVTVSYDITVGDVMRAAAAAARRSRGTVILGILTTLVCATGLFLLGDLVSAVGVVVGISMATGWLTALLVWRQARTKIGPDGMNETMVASPTGLRFHSDRHDDRQTWGDYRRLDDAGGFYLLEGTKGAIQVIPKRAFEPAQLEAFARLLEHAGLTGR